MAASKDTDEGRKTDLDKSGRVNTKVETRTEVVDNTDAAPAREPVEVEIHVAERPNGTIIHTYGEPVGGFPSDKDA